eukprot:Rmarinus@m.16275
MQEDLQKLARRLQAGRWVHIFPEGRCVQKGSLGPLRWGVGRILAHTVIPPVVVPVYHTGMADVMPQDENDDLISWIPRCGKKIRIIVGDPIPVADLMERHYNEKAEEARKLGLPRQDIENFSPADQKFYRDVTLRIQDALKKLEERLKTLDDA